MTIIYIYILIFIILFYQINKYLYKNINYSQFEHFYNSDILYNTINTALYSSLKDVNTFEGMSDSPNLVKKSNINKVDTNNPGYINHHPKLLSNYIYSTPDRNIYFSPYWHNPLDYWLNPNVYYNWYGSPRSYLSSYSTPVINRHRRYNRSGRLRRHGGLKRHGRSRRYR